MGRVVAAYAYRCGCRIAEIQLGESGWAREKGDFVWIGFHEPTEQDLRILQAQFGLHELAVEDALSAHQVPKLEVYGDSLFVVLRTAALEQARSCSARPASSSARTTSSASARAPRNPTCRYGSAARPRPSC